MSRRVFLVVLDSFGIGAAPDAAAFGDAGANTLRGVANTGILSLPNLTAFGLGSIDGVDAIEKVSAPRAQIARLQERSMGKDTTTGHWEMAGIISDAPMPTFPEGFPRELMDEFEAAVGRGTLCNLPYSGTDVIRDYGKEHVETGKLIVYTSADSVFQVAAHEDIVPVEELYEICRTARKMASAHFFGVERSPSRVKPSVFISSDRSIDCGTSRPTLRRTSLCMKTSCGVPSRRILPLSRTTTRSASAASFI